MENETVAIFAILAITLMVGLTISDGMPQDDDDITGYGIRKKFKKAMRRVEKEVSRSAGKVEAEGKRFEDRVKAETKRWDIGSLEAKDIKKKSVERTRESIDRMNSKVIAAARDKLCQTYLQALQGSKDERAAYEQTTSLLKADLRPSIHSMLVANALSFITLDAQEAAKASNDLQGEVEPLVEYQTRKVLDNVIPACKQMIPPTPSPTQPEQPVTSPASQEQPAAPPAPVPVTEAPSPAQPAVEAPAVST